MDTQKVLEMMLNPMVVSVVGAVIGFLFSAWKVAPSKKIVRSISLIEKYAPIIFDAVEEVARVAKNDENAEKIDKALEYEKRIKNILNIYGGVVNDKILAIAKDHAQALHIETKTKK